MYELDPVGRYAPSNLTVSRTAAARHAHISALLERAARPRADSARTRRRRLGWFAPVLARFSWS